ncbi:MAG: type transport system ATP-binding protein [Gaiellales bacterium]|nr:type transport system ATP-binding protein [Gaiellales bacterium]
MSDSGPATIEFDRVSRWYGDTVALADVSFSIGPGVTGLLGHNGAGKSTALRLCGGFSTPKSGSVRVLGLDPKRSPEVYRRLGIVPDHSPPWPFLTAREVVVLCAKLRGVGDPAAAAQRALEEVDLLDVAERSVGGFSHGLRQRVKLAQALAHDPDVLLLDEPLNGLDPAQRRHAVELLRRLGESGRTVVVSSHILHEVERMAPRVLVLVNGRLVAEGETGEIRRLISDRPRRVRITTDGDGINLARDLVGAAAVSAVSLGDDAITVDTDDVERFSRLLPVVAVETGTTLRRVEPIGDDLESVYAYLHDRARGAAR